MGKRALTDAAVAKAKAPAEGQVDHFDAGYPGLALRISAGGRKTWTYFYRHGGKQRRMGIGLYPDVGLADARQAWREAREAVQGGRDPAAEAQARREAALAPVPAFATLAALLGEYEVVARKKTKSWRAKPAGARRRAEGMMKNEPEAKRRISYVFANLLDREVPSITIDEAAQVIMSHQSAGAASRARAYAKSVFDWAAGRGRFKQAGKHRVPKLDTPDLSLVADPQPSAERRARERTLDDAEMTKVWKVVRHSADCYDAGFRALIWTGARLDEVCEMDWRDLDLDAGLWVKPDVKSTKGGPRDQVMPLPKAMVTELKARPDRRPEGRVYANTTGGVLSNWDRATKRVAKAAGVGYIPAEGDEPARVDWQRHDLRRSAASTLVFLGYAPHVADGILGHVNPWKSSGVSAAGAAHYLKVALAEQRTALDAWADHLDALLAPKATAVNAEAVSA